MTTKQVVLPLTTQQMMRAFSLIQTRRGRVNCSNIHHCFIDGQVSFGSFFVFLIKPLMLESQTFCAICTKIIYNNNNSSAHRSFVAKDLFGALKAHKDLFRGNGIARKRSYASAIIFMESKERRKQDSEKRKQKWNSRR